MHRSHDLKKNLQIQQNLLPYNIFSHWQREGMGGVCFSIQGERTAMKQTISTALGLAFACLAGAAWASGPGGMGMGDSAPGSMGVNPLAAGAGGFTMPVNPASLAANYAGSGTMPGNAGMTGGEMPILDLRQVVRQGISSLQQPQRDQLGMNMASQNLQGMAGGMSPVNQIRNSVRDSIMMSRVASISPLGQGTFRPMIMPGAVQSMISQIQPWNFPARFQSAMMPTMIPILSQPIKEQQIAYMQQGIRNNPNFPNVPLPAPAFAPPGYPQQGGYYPQQGGYYPQQGGYYPQQGGYYPQQGGYYPQQGGYYPQQGGYYPQQGGYYPQQGGYYPQQGGGIPGGMGMGW
jgi:hypothetical protein